jgi:hypothetical protein
MGLVLTEKTDSHASAGGTNVEALLLLKGWSNVLSDGSVLSSSATAHTGSCSLKFPLDGAAAAIGPKTFTAATDSWYVHVWVQKPTTGNGNLKIAFTDDTTTTTPDSNNLFTWTIKTSGSVATLAISGSNVYNVSSNASWEGKGVGSWALLELFLSKTTGWKIYLNGTLISSGAANVGSGKALDRIMVRCDGGVGSDILIDDLFVFTDPAFSATLGTGHYVKVINPASVGDSSEFTLVSGASKVIAASAPFASGQLTGTSPSKQNFNFTIPNGRCRGLTVVEHRQMTAGSVNRDLIKRASSVDNSIDYGLVSSTSAEINESVFEEDPVLSQPWAPGTHQLGIHI